MQWNIDFELTRLLRLLTERLVPGCLEQGLAAEDIAGLTKEISFEGEKVYIEVMKVMCRPHSDEHMRRYLEVHLLGAEHLQEQVEELVGKAGDRCREIFEVFEKVLGQVLNCLGKWQERYFGNGIDPKDWLTKAGVEEELHITQSTFYRRKKDSKWKTRIINGIEHYLRSSLYE